LLIAKRPVAALGVDELGLIWLDVGFVVGIGQGVLQGVEAGHSEYYVALEIADVVRAELGPDFFALRAE
jgi:hypothetical protein